MTIFLGFLAVIVFLWLIGDADISYYGTRPQKEPPGQEKKSMTRRLLSLSDSEEE